MDVVLKSAAKEDLVRLAKELEHMVSFVEYFPVEITFNGEKYVFDNVPEIFDFLTNIKALLQ